MYGLLLQNLSQYVINVYGEKKWEEIRTGLKIKEVGAIDKCPTFSYGRVSLLG